MEEEEKAKKRGGGTAPFKDRFLLFDGASGAGRGAVMEAGVLLPRWPPRAFLCSALWP